MLKNLMTKFEHPSKCMITLLFLFSAGKTQGEEAIVFSGSISSFGH